MGVAYRAGAAGGASDAGTADRIAADQPRARSARNGRCDDGDAGPADVAGLAEINRRHFPFKGGNNFNKK